MSGSEGSTSLSDLIFEPLFQTFLSCVDGQAVDLEVLVGRDGDAVVGDLDLVVLDAALLADGASSSGLIGREASEMSVSPAQNFSKPPPVPDWPTEIFTSGLSSLKSSAAAWANG